LDAFIDKYVLCASCKNPETELVIKGRSGHEDVTRDCKACGAHTGVDMRHKLTTFVIKNPPKKDKKGGKGKKGMTAEANVGGPMVFDKADDGSGEEPGSPDGDHGVPTSGTDIDAVLGRSSDPVLGDPDAAEEVSKKLAAVDLGTPGGGGGDDEDDEDAADSPYAQLGAWLEENRDVGDAEVIAKIKELGIVGKHKVLVEMGQKMFTDDIAKELPKRTSLLQAVSRVVDYNGRDKLIKILACYL
jgi:translation initiation factor 5